MNALLIFATLFIVRIALPVTVLVALGTWVERHTRAAHLRRWTR